MTKAKMSPVVHFELPADDRKRMMKFYTDAFGWKTEQLGKEMGDYVLATATETDKMGMIKTPGHINGGFFQRTDKATHPSIVIAVDDINEGIKKVEKAKGTVLGKPMDIPGVGMFVGFIDTEGNTLSMLQPHPRKEKK